MSILKLGNKHFHFVKLVLHRGVCVRQPAAKKIARELFNDLVEIDQAAMNANSNLAARNYQAAYTDIEGFLRLLPKKDLYLKEAKIGRIQVEETEQ